MLDIRTWHKQLLRIVAREKGVDFEFPSKFVLWPLPSLFMNAHHNERKDGTKVGYLPFAKTENWKGSSIRDSCLGTKSI